MPRESRNNIIIFAAILIVAVLLRGLLLGQIPPGIHPDAAANALDAWRAYTTHHHQVFYTANFGREGLLINIISYSFQIFGPTLIAYKLPSVLVGIFSVVGMYFLGKNIHRQRRLGLISAFLLAISFWMIVFERTGLRATVSVACVIWTSTFFLLALRQEKWHWYTLTGIFLGLGLNTYISFRLMPVVLLLGFLYHAWLQRKVTGLPMSATWKKHRYIFLTVVVSLAISLPLGLYFFHHPSYILGRADEVSVFTQPHSLLRLAESTIANLSIFSFFGDPNWRHNISTQPLLDVWQSILFYIGIILTWKQARRVKKQNDPDSIIDTSAGVYILILLGLMIIPAATTYSPGGVPHSLRIIDTAPAVYVLVAIGGSIILGWLLRTFEGQQKRIYLAMGLVAVVMTCNTSVQYFSPRWGLNHQVAHEYSQDYTRVSAYINQQARSGKLIYLVNTSSETEFFTINTPNLLRSAVSKASDILAFQPSIIIITTGTAADQDLTADLHKQGWTDVRLDLGEGGHSIIALQHG